MEDKLLVTRVLQGDTQAFAVIVKTTERLVAQIVFKMIRNAEARKDIAQDVYLNAYKNLSRFKFQSKLSTWIAQIAYNACLNYLEKKKITLFDSTFTQDESDGSQLERIAGTLVDTAESEVESKLFQSERTTIVLAALERLPPVYNTLITLYHYEELSYEEIAQITKLPIGTVKNYLFRARKLLKEHLLIKYTNEEI
ncbi:sigma-70 family RNA polymerase sigma factor [Cytophagaceae bacterium DM2B3-1]|uniref:Sigma-70 family RNA polymerase sigma factor n=1 Tax=Xanthocytophaga flava TaxID=3048013 RepID=A0AAE3QU46_9BACT|nr:sigma-70 family RNA polymerase sigma factor [Xanthocytophaga flavus]MDJ1482844.1 sigma-70 family RNA polymerase sigma factor [Xanthocytophaga flavus]MDJ1496171.1 sigma-70 family RNA polymerase sigma factor [Xanthocytophaga flavus]